MLPVVDIQPIEPSFPRLQLFWIFPLSAYAIGFSSIKLPILWKRADDLKSKTRPGYPLPKHLLYFFSLPLRIVALLPSQSPPTVRNRVLGKCYLCTFKVLHEKKDVQPLRVVVFNELLPRNIDTRHERTYLVILTSLWAGLHRRQTTYLQMTLETEYDSFIVFMNSW